MNNKEKLETIQRMLNLLEQLENKQDKTQKEIDLQHICSTFFDSVTKFLYIFTEEEKEKVEFNLSKLCPKQKIPTLSKPNPTIFKVNPSPYVPHSSHTTVVKDNKQEVFDEAMAFGAGLNAGGVASFCAPDTKLEDQQIAEFNLIMKNMDFTDK